MATVRQPRNLDLDRSLQTLKWSPLAEPVSYKKGGKVRKSGLAMVHRGETIISRGKAKKSKRKTRPKRATLWPHATSVLASSKASR
jgi:hypothetical protein